MKLGQPRQPRSGARTTSWRYTVLAKVVCALLPCHQVDLHVVLGFRSMGAVCDPSPPQNRGAGVHCHYFGHFGNVRNHMTTTFWPVACMLACFCVARAHCWASRAQALWAGIRVIYTSSSTLLVRTVGRLSTKLTTKPDAGMLHVCVVWLSALIP